MFLLHFLLLVCAKPFGSMLAGLSLENRPRDLPSRIYTMSQFLF